MYPATRIERFDENVRLKYQLFNSIFITLPFTDIDNTGVLLPLFSEICEDGFKKQKSPEEIFNYFSDKYLTEATEQDKISLMFRFIQYVERQVVLFDAIEDAAFTTLNNLEGSGTLREAREKAENLGQMEDLRNFLEDFTVRPVLTAHPTQFYPGSVLGIITDLTEAIKNNDLGEVKTLLAQLGKTPFIKKEKPTPFDEAVSLLWYLQNVFYKAAGDISSYVQDAIYKGRLLPAPVISFGFWPGGDRDGNPFVTTEITLNVAERLRNTILKCYYLDVRKLKRHLTFNGIQDKITDLEYKLYRSVYYSEGEKIFITLNELKDTISQIREIVITHHQSLYLDEIDDLINKINLFGFHFASLDIRQNSHIHNSVFSDVIKHLEENHEFTKDYSSLSEEDKIKALNGINAKISPEQFEGENTRKTLESILAIKTIQERNGELGSNRYIISNNESALNVMELLKMFGLLGWDKPTVDIVPLFETVDDLEEAGHAMKLLYENEMYAAHLKRRGSTQTIMLGFSDGTKDGGYLMANWGIFKAKENLTQMAREYGIKVIFFDGRGGPPARGGGKTHKFYASLGSTIDNNEIQVTVQGQTISSNFGTLESCRFNLENLLSAGITNGVFKKEDKQFTPEQKELMEAMAHLGYEKYMAFKAHPKFLPYLERMSTLNYYSKANIGSRPSKRNTGELNFSDLRAIPFVGSWAQLKQNVPGFFGVGYALGHYEKEGRWEEVASLYRESLFFRTLLENSMMSLSKSFFPLTAYMKNDPEFGDFWQIIYDEYLETRRLLLKISGYSELMENYPDGWASIKMRESIVLPLLTIQQYALIKIRQIKSGKGDEALLETYEKIVTRSLFGNINASRNSA
ncbi:phosphoenolpyruvate carboxylase [Flavobacterium sp. RHBU_3]|uniref:phosphoenolpyruvate carboxylase n=1 Tax=Flavobacterium sp. RHBU_3 TaxID=3391184 RepID=UPI00398503C7